LHWGFTDPSSFDGTFEEKKAKTRTVRDEIETKIKQWLKEIEQ
jgi:arsenate reductase